MLSSGSFCLATWAKGTKWLGKRNQYSFLYKRDSSQSPEMLKFWGQSGLKAKMLALKNIGHRGRCQIFWPYRLEGLDLSIWLCLTSILLHTHTCFKQQGGYIFACVLVLMLTLTASFYSTNVRPALLMIWIPVLEAVHKNVHQKRQKTLYNTFSAA